MERWFGPLTRRQIRCGVHRSTPEFEQAIRRYIEVCNEGPQPFVSAKSADGILANLAKYRQRISASGH